MNAQRLNMVYPAGLSVGRWRSSSISIIVAIITVITLVALNLLMDFFQATLFTALVIDTRLQRSIHLVGKIINFAISYLLILFYFAVCWSLVGFTPGMYLMRVAHRPQERRIAELLPLAGARVPVHPVGAGAVPGLLLGDR